MATDHLHSTDGGDQGILAASGEEIGYQNDLFLDPSAVTNDAAVTNINNKRSASEVQRLSEEAEEQSTTKRRRKNPNAPPKKLNNEQWDLMFDRLVKYKQEHGNCLVPKRYTHDPKLGTWVETQRIQWKKLPRTQDEASGQVEIHPNNRLNDERLKRLESIGFAWSAKNVRKPKPSSSPTAKKNPLADPAEKAAARQRESDKQWMEMYNRLVVYRNTHGDCLVPKKYQEDPKLASWVETQRNLYNREYKPKVSLKASPDSGASSSNEDVPASATAAAMSTAKSPEEWADEMEKAASGAAAAMDNTGEGTAAMDVEAATMQVVDEVTAGEDLDTNAAAAVAAAALAMDQQQQQPEGDVKPAAKRLTEERKNMLEHLGFVWSVRSKKTDDHWDEMYRQMVEYKEQHGDCLVPSRYEPNLKLGKWVETQRYEYTKLQRKAGQADSPPVEEQPQPEEGKAGKKGRSNHPRLTEERLRRLEAIGFEWKVKNKMKRYYDRQWDGMFEKLLQFKADHGHCLVPKRYPQDMKLGTWVHTQRIQYRKMLQGSGAAKKEEPLEGVEGEGPEKGEEEEKSSRLTEERRRRLDEVGFLWSARATEQPVARVKVSRNSYDDQWDGMFERLKAYKERHGHVLVPKRCREDPKLGTWVDTQRVQRKKMLKHMALQEQQAESPGEGPPVGKAPGRLTADRMARLESVGFVWSLRDDWQKHYNELKAYKEQHGHCNVPARYAENRKLGIWVSAQRQQKRLLDSTVDAKPNRSTPLTQERIHLLDDIGFTWTIRSRDILGDTWNQRYEELKAFQQEHGDCLVPSRYAKNPELGIWVGTQRTQYRLFMKAKESGKSQKPGNSSAMNEERLAKLEALGFTWALRGGSDSMWRKRINDLLEYRTAHGNTAVPSNYKGNKKLGIWASTQRVQYRLLKEGKQSTLDDERVAELDSLQFPWVEPAEPPAEVREEPVEPSNEASDEIVQDAVAGAFAAAAVADVNNSVPMELDVEVPMIGGVEHAGEEATAEDIMNVEL